jgi:hypothetical protein
MQELMVIRQFVKAVYHQLTFGLITGEHRAWSRLTGTGGFNAAAGTLYRQALLPVRLNIYFQQHLLLQMRASLQ